MIFVTVGSGVKGIEFTRLIKGMDQIAGEIQEQVVMQIGSVSYQPRNARYFRYTSFQDNLLNFRKASLIVGHCGIGTILNALKFEKPIIVVPRRIKYGELNRDDHQVEIARKIEGNPLVHVVYEIEDLENAIKTIRGGIGAASGSGSFPGREKLIETIKNFVKMVG